MWYILAIMKMSWPIVVFAIVLVAILGLSCYTNQPTYIPQSQAPHSSPQVQMVSDLPTGWQRLFEWPEGITVLVVTLTLFFIAWQATLTRQAILSSESSSKTELRAYLGVVVSGGSFQDRDKKIKFEGIPVLKNSGKTPAHNVIYRTNSAVLREPLDKNWNLPPGKEEVGEYDLGSNQNYTLHIIMDDYVDPKDVADIMSGTKGRAFYYWGTINYDDAFGDAHVTQFCHRLFFVPSEKKPGTYNVFGNYVAGRNSST
jgi:hypothetical protein